MIDGKLEKFVAKKAQKHGFDWQQDYGGGALVKAPKLCQWLLRTFQPCRTTVGPPPGRGCEDVLLSLLAPAAWCSEPAISTV